MTMAYTPGEDATAAVMGLDEDSFRSLVREHLGRHRSPELWSTLCSPKVIERTYQVLVEMLRSVDGTLAGRKLDQASATEEEYEVWRRRAVNFKRTVEDRLSTVKNARRNRHDVQVGRDNVANRRALRRLAQAVYAHQSASVSAGFTPKPHDRELWMALDRLTVPMSDIDITLRDLLDGGAWPLVEGAS